MMRGESTRAPSGRWRGYLLFPLRLVGLVSLCYARPEVGNGEIVLSPLGMPRLIQVFPTLPALSVDDIHHNGAYAIEPEKDEFSLFCLDWLCRKNADSPIPLSELKIDFVV